MAESESGDRAANLKSIIEQLNATPAAAATGGDLSSRDKRARSTARLASVQALYQMELSGVGVETVIREFSDHRFDVDEDGVSLPRADEAFFQDLLRSVVRDQNAIDRAISERLAADWRLDRLDATLRAILRAGVFELLHRKDIGVEIVIDEYVELTKAFFSDVEAKFVNACLDGVRRDQPA